MPAWDKVRNALANPKFEFRTIEGIARETDLDETVIKKLLAEHEKDVRRGLSTDKKGRLIYTLRERNPTFRELASNVVTIVSSSSSST